MEQAILVLNVGSSSIKFALFGREGGRVLRRALHGAIERIHEAPHFTALAADGSKLAEQTFPPSPPQTPETLLAALLDFVTTHLGTDKLLGVGHRVVHGGMRFRAPLALTPPVLAALEELVPLAPLHQPHNLAAIRAVTALRPDLAQVACFDTAFHAGLSAEAAGLALPRALRDSGVRRYGFHGLSYEYIARRLAELAPDLAAGRVIAAHLGNGASLCALQAGRSVDTTMGMTALDGLMMGTRCGTLDPGVVLYLQQARGMDVGAIETMLYSQSGLLGVSGLSGDMRVLLAHQENPAARAAVDLFVFRIARECGGLASTLGGLDGLVFTAGIGEHAPAIRAAVCARLGWLGIRLDDAANQAGGGAHGGRISAADSTTQAWVIPTDEEATIARHALDILVPQ